MEYIYIYINFINGNCECCQKHFRSPEKIVQPNAKGSWKWVPHPMPHQHRLGRFLSSERLPGAALVVICTGQHSSNCLQKPSCHDIFRLEQLRYREARKESGVCKELHVFVLEQDPADK